MKKIEKNWICNKLQGVNFTLCYVLQTQKAVGANKLAAI
jgi:hypothetical protein